MASFRVHFADGKKLIVEAPTADAARKLPQVVAGGHVSKIKRDKGRPS